MASELQELAIDFLNDLQAKLPLELTYVAPCAREATVDNAIPLMLSSACAEILQGEVETEIVQASPVCSTPVPRRWSACCSVPSSMGLSGRHPG